MTETRQITATVPEETVNAIVAYSKAQDRSFSYLVAQILEEWVKRLKTAENGSLTTQITNP